MRIWFFTRKMAASSLLVPVLLWLSSLWAKVAMGSPFLLPAPENTSDRGLPALWGTQSSGDILQWHTGFPDLWVTPLEDLKPPAQPVIRREPSPQKPGIRLSCQVPWGAVDAIEWKRDGKPLSGGQRDVVLLLPGMETSHCGSYSCNASNRWGWKESPRLDVTAGISMMLGVAFQLSASALVSAAFSGWGILLPLCQPHKLRIRGKAWKWLSIYVNGLTGLASALAFVALILWSYDQGLSAALILPLFLLLYVVMVTLLVLGNVAFSLNTIHQITDPAAQRLVDFSTPTGVILVAVTCSLLIRQVVKLEEQGCATPVDLTPVVAGTAGMCFLPFTAIVAVHCADMKKRTAEDRTSRRENWKKAIQSGTIQFL
ncbi:uncharacterized protein LOC118078646 [Zootoca vivipara]|uniref:uncharacterized protein LOC118078646 n=1 Tax=Zootoca vivipara TaxID=8524 RepID=UPI00293C0E3A|nr:uncharacterized protein LOC118078646 [Zootoca vivipara]